MDKPEDKLMVPVCDAESYSSECSLDLFRKVKKESNSAHKSFSKELRVEEVKRKPAAGNLGSEKEEDFLLKIEANPPPTSKWANCLSAGGFK